MFVRRHQRSKSVGIALFVMALICFPPLNAQADSGLKEKIQQELDGNPFLKKEGLKLYVIEEENGYVTIEVCAGNRRLREAINKGTDILAEGDYQGKRWIDEGSNEGERKAANVLRQSVTYIQEMEGVKRVLLTAVVNTLEDRRLDDFARMHKHLGSLAGPEVMRQMVLNKRYAELNELLRKLASEGDPVAKTFLAISYISGRDFFDQPIPKDFVSGAKLLQEAADKGEPQAKVMLSMMCLAGQGVPRDCAKAIKLLRETSEKDMVLAPLSLISLAEIFAADPDPAFHNGPEAVELAHQAISLCGSERSADVTLLEALAAAYARNGQFDKAIEVQEEVVRRLSKTEGSTPPEDQKDRSINVTKAKETLGLYKNNTPYTYTEQDILGAP